MDTSTDCPLAVALADRLREQRDALTSRWLLRIADRVALTHGGACDGAPGLRPAYGEHYYATFVRDPDGHRLEAVFDGVAAGQP